MTADTEAILAAFREHVEGRGGDPAVTLESDLFQDLGYDSLDAAELALFMEERFSIELPESEMENVSTVGDVVTLVQERSKDSHG